MDKQASKTAEAGRPICPECGKAEPMRIAYGYPSGEMIEVSARGEVVLGGCIVDQTLRPGDAGRAATRGAVRHHRSTASRRSSREGQGDAVEAAERSRSRRAG